VSNIWTLCVAKSYTGLVHVSQICVCIKYLMMLGPGLFFGFKFSDTFMSNCKYRTKLLDTVIF
jgi:hypothetical protein